MKYIIPILLCAATSVHTKESPIAANTTQKSPSSYARVVTTSQTPISAFGLYAVHKSQANAEVDGLPQQSMPNPWVKKTAMKDIPALFPLMSTADRLGKLKKIRIVYPNQTEVIIENPTTQTYTITADPGNTLYKVHYSS